MLYRAQHLRDYHYLGPQRGVTDAVGLSPSSNQHIEVPPGRSESGQHLRTSDLAKPSLQAVTVHHRPPVPRDDQAQPRTRRGGRREEDVEVRRPLPLPPPEEPPNFARPPNPARARQPLGEGAVVRTRSRAARAHRLTWSRWSPPNVHARAAAASRALGVRPAFSCGNGSRACLHACDYEACMLASLPVAYSYVHRWIRSTKRYPSPRTKVKTTRTKIGRKAVRSCAPFDFSTPPI